MTVRRAVFNVVSGPNQGDTVSLEPGSCRLIGRHLSENETALIDRDGNRVIDGAAAEIITGHLKEKSPPIGVSSPNQFSADTFERGADVILADDSISRAHAMLFCDDSAVGIIDLASTNGTFLDTERVSSAVVPDGATLSLGNSEVRVQIR